LALGKANGGCDAEKNRKVLQEATLEWLRRGTVKGQRTGMLSADANGVIR
jgi:hypothetical protein